MKQPLTAIFEKMPLGYIGYVEELPGANTQSATLAETKANLREAIALVFDENLARKICKDLGVAKS